MQYIYKEILDKLIERANLEHREIQKVGAKPLLLHIYQNEPIGVMLPCVKGTAISLTVWRGEYCVFHFCRILQTDEVTPEKEEILKDQLAETFLVTSLLMKSEVEALVEQSATQLNPLFVKKRPYDK